MKLLVSGIIGAVSLFGGIFLINSGGEGKLGPEEKMIVMRNVGHHVLLAAGDSTSRVLPVSAIGEGSYLIRFESPFTFEADTLVKVIHRGMGKLAHAESMPEEYIVNVLRCVGEEVIYGYQIAGTKESTLVPCSGREQPKDCYMIRITFQESSFFNAKMGLQFFAGFLAAGFLFAGLIFTRKIGRKPDTERKLPSIGKYSFDFDRRTLSHGSSDIELTAKEAQLLKLFSENPNQVLDRDGLLKKVWEDEGVFVGRSLDMFVSRLRKKLRSDPGIRITNVHGKGYKLEVD